MIGSVGLAGTLNYRGTESNRCWKCWYSLPAGLLPTGWLLGTA